MKHTPWLLTGTIVGAVFATMTAPPPMGSSPMMERQTILFAVWILSGTMLGLFGGLVADFFKLK